MFGPAALVELGARRTRDGRLHGQPHSPARRTLPSMGACSLPPIATWRRSCVKEHFARILYYRLKVFTIQLPALRRKTCTCAESGANFSRLLRSSGRCLLGFQGRWANFPFIVPQVNLCQERRVTKALSSRDSQSQHIRTLRHEIFIELVSSPSRHDVGLSQ